MPVARLTRRPVPAALLALLAAALLLTGAAAPTAHAARRAPAAVTRWAAAGIDTVRIQVRWVGVAPGALSTVAPLSFERPRSERSRSGFQHPFFADVLARAPRVRFWGQVRSGAAHAVSLQRRSPSGTFVTIKHVRTDRRGTFTATLTVASRGGSYRYRTADRAPAVNVTSDVLAVTPHLTAKGHR